eukprot:jgi/Psemu1/35808/gm1.35808_g
MPDDPPEEPEEEEDSKLPARSPTVSYDEEDDLQEPPEHLWKKIRTIASIANVFDLSDRRSFRDTVRQVCQDVVLCQQANLSYTGKGNHQAVGRKSVILLDSVEAEVIADALESANSINMTTYIINQYREKNEFSSLTYSAVRGCMNRLKPQVLAIKKGKFGKVKFCHPLFSKLLGDDYDAHIGVSGSRVGPGKLYATISFKQNSEGKLDPNGMCSNHKTVLQVKYDKEGRWALGVYMDAKKIDHSCYDELWEEEIDKVCMTGQVCVTALIDYMFKSTQEVMGDSGFVMYDALSFMTSANSVAYMTEKGYYDQWVLPQHDLMGPSGGIGGNLAHYHDRSVGNRPEISLLDTSLFSQLYNAVNFHVHITSTLPDKVKFSKATPSAIFNINKVLRSLQIIADHEELTVDSIGDRKGRRHIPKSQLGGKHVRKLAEDCYDQEKIELHEDAALAPAAIIHNAQLKFETQEKLDYE